MEQRQLVVPITTPSSVLEPVGGSEYWEIENPDTNPTTIFANLNAPASTTATQSSAIRPGSKWFAVVNPFKNPNGVSLIAATSATTVILRKETFRTRLHSGLGVIAGSVSAIVANNFWRLVAGSATAIEPNGAVVEARADTVRPKTAATAMSIADSSDVSRINITASGNAIMRSADLSDRFVVSNGLGLVQMNNATTMGFTDATTQFRNMATTAVALFDP